MNGAHTHLILSHFPVAALPLGLFLFIISALTIIPLYVVGEGAERILETVASISEKNVQAHESKALFALIAAQVLGVISLVALGLVLYTANLGGYIRHGEISALAVPRPRAVA